MKKLNLLYILVLSGLLLTQVTTAEDNIYEKGLTLIGQKSVPGEIIVKFKAEVTEETITSLNSTYGTHTIYTSSLAGFRILKIPQGKTITEIVNLYKANANVEYAEANYLVYAMMIPNDWLYPYQWHLYNNNYGGIHMQFAWDISTGSDVVVAILDTGIAYEDYCEEFDAWTRYYEQAPDLANTYFIQGYDFVNNDEHANDDSNPGHGTHIAGIIAQNTNNNIGTAGIAFGACLMPVKVLDSTGIGTHADVADGIIWAVDNGAYVINLGFGGSEPSKTLENALAYAYNKGVVLIAAAGNNSANTVSYPAAYNSYVIAVGATRYNETLAHYSNTGPSLDLVAPGGDLSVDQNGDGYGDGILQQTYEKTGLSSMSWGYCFMEGTSMAAAHVSSVAALLIANGVATTPTDIKQAIESTAEDKGTAGWDLYYGWGIVNAYAALQWTPPPIPPSPMAEFKAEPTTGLVPLIVQFTDQSTGEIGSWLWDFGDGEKSTEKNPTHQYGKFGLYTVSLTVTGPKGSNTKTKTNYITANIKIHPVVNFDANPETGNAPLTVQFTDKTTYFLYFTGGFITSTLYYEKPDGIISWSWDFGDGGTSNERNPSYTYQHPGTYTVSLTVICPTESGTETQVDCIKIPSYQPPGAEFIAEPRSGLAPLTVQFTSKSTGAITNTTWTFGDGGESTEQNPTYTYQSPGKYTVSLKVTGPGGTDIKNKTDYIDVLKPPAPVADFIGEPTSGMVPTTVQFTNKSTGRITSTTWSFGDGENSTESNPSHTYKTAGDYTVTLNIKGPGGLSTKAKTNYIHIDPPPIPTVYVNIKKSTESFWFWKKVTVTITVTYIDADGPPMENAIVEGHWSGACSGSATLITNNDGKVTLKTGWVSASGSVKFTVDKVIKEEQECIVNGETSK